MLKGGAASGFNHVTDIFEPRLFHVKGRRSPTVTQHPISWEHFNSGDVFIIDTKEIVFVWVGRSANNMEKLQASKVRSLNKSLDCCLLLLFLSSSIRENSALS
jgi:villin 1/advillin